LHAYVNQQEIDKEKNPNRPTKRPIMHGGWPANNLSVLLQNCQWRRAREEVEGQDTSNYFECELIPFVYHIHSIAIEEKNSNLLHLADVGTYEDGNLHSSSHPYRMEEMHTS
jgi:hypothetical protein